MEKLSVNATKNNDSKASGKYFLQKTLVKQSTDVIFYLYKQGMQNIFLNHKK